MNKNIQDVKMEVETIKKSLRETILKIENLGKRSGVIDATITKRIQEIEERISVTEHNIEIIDTTVKVIEKCQKIVTQKIQEILHTMRTPNLRIIGMEECEDSQLEGPVMSSTKLKKETFLT